MSKIDEKHQQLKTAGLDLGAPLAPETTEAAGGQVRRYEHGNIYWHENTGAHEVHGGILACYLENGGPGPSSRTGRRELGYPTTDEQPGATPSSQFEWGEIYWVENVGGCLLRGAIWGRLRQGPDVGLPLTGNFPLADGEAAFFERGVIFSAAAAGKTRVITGYLTPPLLGQPEIVDLSQPASPGFVLELRWAQIMKEDHEALLALRPSVYTDILAARYSLSPVDRDDARLPMQVLDFHVYGTFQLDVKVSLSVAARTLTDRTLYDLRCALPNGSHYALSPHCVYAKRGWEDFGLLHITDLHISRRNDSYRARLHAGGLDASADGYSNFQDNLRDFLRYANHLHALGLADAVMATGDLVDYVQEEAEGDHANNFVGLRRLLLGQAFSAGSPVGEELKLPIFTTFGNHDYRAHPYYLRSNVAAPGGSYGQAINQFGGHNLLESDAISLQAGQTRTFGVSDAEEALRSLWRDQAENFYGEFHKYFSRERHYVVTLGKNRLIVLDTGYDDGIPDGQNSLTNLFLNIAKNEATQKLLFGGGPNSIGFDDGQLSLLRNAIHAADPGGTVIVGMHAPAISPKSGDYPYFMRETTHPNAEPALTAGYVAKNGLDGATWPRRGTGYFKTGTTGDGLDVGIAVNKNQEFLEACAGVGLSRPVDLILCGHVHRSVEHRFRHTGSGGFEFYTDFYTENPAVFYPTNNVPPIAGLPDDARIAVRVVAGVTASSEVGIVRDHQTSPPGISIPETTYGEVKVPPYPRTLEAATDARAWWLDHRPLHAQTSALGPIDSRQRFGVFYRLTNPPQKWRPIIESDRGLSGAGTADGFTPIPQPFKAPTFQGFRFIRVKGNVIEKMRYVTLHDLRHNGFTMSWETPGRVFEPVIIGGTPGRSTGTVP